MTAKLLISSVAVVAREGWPSGPCFAGSGESARTVGAEKRCDCSATERPALPSRSAIAIEATAWRIRVTVRLVPGSLA